MMARFLVAACAEGILGRDERLGVGNCRKLMIYNGFPSCGSPGVTRSFTWPINSPRDETTEREAAWVALDHFVQTQSYMIVWSNDFFQILVPEPTPVH